MQLLQHRTHDTLVTVIRGGGPAIETHVQLVPKRGEVLRDAFDKLRRALPRLFGALLHLLAVLIHAGEEVHLASREPLKPRHDIGEHLFIRVADVRRRVGVINGGRDVEGLHGAPFMPSGGRSCKCSVQAVIPGGKWRRERDSNPR